jgi:hypothetical protein
MPHVPLLTLSLTIATLYGALFHLLRGRTLQELLIYWVAAVAGFAGGQLLASGLSWPDVLIGELHLVAASLACWLFLAFAERLKP